MIRKKQHEKTESASEEWAKTTGKAVDAVREATTELYEDVVELFVQVLGPSARNIGAIGSDWTLYWRFKNLCRIRDKVAAIQRERGLEGRLYVPLPTRLALPLLTSASEEDDEKLQDFWAGLIANWTEPENRFHRAKVFIDILSSLEPLDALVLQGLRHGKALMHAEELAAPLSATEHDMDLSLSNLVRLGCIKRVGGAGRTSSLFSQYHSFGQTYGVTIFGAALIDACNPRLPTDESL